MTVMVQLIRCSFYYGEAVRFGLFSIVDGDLQTVRVRTDAYVIFSRLISAWCMLHSCIGLAND